MEAGALVGSDAFSVPCRPPTPPQENYELHQVELGPGPGGDMVAKMSKKKAASGGGKRKEKLENMKKEMEIVSRGWAGLGEGKGRGPGDRK